MNVKNWFVAFAGGYFTWVFIRNGTLGKIFNDANRGAQDISRGLRGASRLA